MGRCDSAELILYHRLVREKIDIQMKTKRNKLEKRDRHQTTETLIQKESQIPK